MTRQDVINAEKIWGPDVGALKGKTTRKKGKHFKTKLYAIPTEIMSKYQEVTICGDVMFVNQIPFLVTISRHLKFGTVEMLRKTNNATMVKAIEQVKQVYNMRGFKVETMLADGQFETTRGKIADMGIVLNTASPEEHVPEVERQIRTLKEKARSVVNVLPFKKIPPRMLSLIHI